MRPGISLFALALTLSLAASNLLAKGLYIPPKPGPQSLEGVLVQDQGALKFIRKAGTKEEEPFLVRPLRGSKKIWKTLVEISVERRVVPLVGETEMVEKNGLIIPVQKEPKNPYEKALFRTFHGMMTAHGEFHIERFEQPLEGTKLESLLPMAQDVVRQVIRSKDKQELDMAYTILVKTGVMDEILAKVGPIFAAAQEE